MRPYGGSHACRHALARNTLAVVTLLVGLLLTIAPAAIASTAGHSASAVRLDPRAEAVACPATNLCVSVDEGGRAVIFDPIHPSSRRVYTFEPGATDRAAGIACASPEQCTIVDGGREITFVPSTLATLSSATVDAAVIETLTCTSTTDCTAVDIHGGEVTFDPLVPGTPLPAQIDPGAYLTDVSCPDPHLCVASDTTAEPFRYGLVVTFDPNSPSTATVVQLGSAHPGSEALGGVSAISCPSSTECVAGLDGDQNIAVFDPHDPAYARLMITGVDGGGNVVRCPSTTQCSAINGTEKVVTFDPTSPKPRFSTALSISLPGGRGLMGLMGLACESLTQCTAVAETGLEATFNPKHVIQPPHKPAPPRKVKIHIASVIQLPGGVLVIKVHRTAEARGVVKLEVSRIIGANGAYGFRTMASSHRATIAFKVVLAPGQWYVAAQFTGARGWASTGSGRLLTVR